jgi:hypothetical protein
LFDFRLLQQNLPMADMRGGIYSGDWRIDRAALCLC